MKNKIARGCISLAVFAVIYILADPITRMPTYDGTAEAIQYLAAVMGAGCYWIGSRD